MCYIHSKVDKEGKSDIEIAGAGKRRGNLVFMFILYFNAWTPKLPSGNVSVSNSLCKSPTLTFILGINTQLYHSIYGASILFYS